MRYLSDDKGMALVMALVLAVISLAFASLLLYIGVQGTKTTGLEKRYRTAMGAAKGGVEHSSKVIDYNANDPSTLGIFAGTAERGCFEEKLNNETADWSSQSNCIGLPSQLTSDVETAPDMVLDLGVSPYRYLVSIKIIDTVAGNSPPVTGGTGGGGAGGGMIETKAVVEGGKSSGIITPMHMPFLYTVEVRSVNADNEDEVAHITYLYEH